MIEEVGAIALFLGVGTGIASALLGLIMIGAIFTVKFPDGFLNGYAYDLVLLALAVYFVLNGSKLFSLGQLMVKGKEA
ncbi:hypothetical protein A8F94_10095 [Bacillus sp. FJAT-27225]|uniref:DoxX family protein n=1 Tax=Bacillus sp. FJAT-27225 TaxID=1743144 RepID=UPI00080C32C6|nr:hypothetical protein [Bacillus sp. FJAT-27225]OCA88153.1 hypothetical protein A8F94_10095 [Bacillus sp. FJAT-27225]